MIRLPQRENGFSLVEMMAAILVFALMTLGIAPLLASSLRGSAKSRSYTQGKNVALEAMERVRQLPYFVSYGAQPRRVDVLDLYYPCAANTATACSSGSTYDTGLSGGPGVRTVCTSTSANPGCAREVAPGYTVTYAAQLVQPRAGVDPATSQSYEDYQVVAPLATYAWNNSTRDVPETRLLRMAVTASWTLFGRTERFTLRSLVSERKFATERVRGSGRVDYAAQILTTFREPLPPNRLSELSAVAGGAESEIETRLLSQADQTATGGQLRLVRPAADPTPATDLVPPASGAGSAYHAPPDVSPAAGTSKVNQEILHPDLSLTRVAYLGPTSTSSLEVKVGGELPTARGTSTAALGTNSLAFWVNNQAELGQNTLLHLDASEARPLISLRGGSITSTTTATATATTDVNRRVQTTASTTFPDMRLFPVTFIPGNQTVRSLVQLQNFSAAVDCKASKTSTPVVTGTYAGRAQVWAERNQTLEGDGVTDGQFISFDLGTPDGRTSFNAYGPNRTNPIVYEEPLLGGIEGGIGNEFDAYLFASPVDPVNNPRGEKFIHSHTTSPASPENPILHRHPAYLTSWSAVSSASTTASADNTSASASFSGAILYNTVPTNPEIAQTGLNVSIGSLSCEAVDKR
jgi:prepilin-type N-terminal cleavage/methylation domain-containing protein